MVLTGRYFDGKTSHCHHVTLKLDDEGMLSVDPEVFAPLPFKDIKVSSRIGNVSRTLQFPSGAILETDDHERLDAWLQAGRRHRDWAHALESRFGYAIGALVFLVGFVLVGAVWGIPWISNAIAYMLPARVSTYLGQGSLESLDKLAFDETHLDKARREELRRRFAALLPADREGVNYKLEFRSSALIGPNAFALPGGTIVVTDELIDLADNNDEIAAILLHEIGHIVHRHSLKQIISHSGLAVLTVALTGDAGSAGGLILALPNILMESSYSRDFEREADDYALQEMKRTGLATDHFANIMERLEDYATLGVDETDKPRSTSRWLDYVSTHPPSADRIARFRSPGYRPDNSLPQPRLLTEVKAAPLPDVLELRSLLVSGNYAELEKRLNAYQRAYEEHSGSEITVATAYAAFATSDPAYLPRFSAWLKAVPDSYSAYLARGNYFYGLAWIKRGAASAGETDKEQFAAMRETQDLAMSDLNAALAINPKLTVAYGRLIAIAASRNEENQKQGYIKAALDIDPTSAVVRGTALQFLTPRWGGSYQKISRFVRDTGKYLYINPELKPLMGFLYHARASSNFDGSKFDRTVRLETIAIRTGRQSPDYFYKRGQAYFYLHEYKAALIDYSNAIKLDSMNGDFYLWRGYALAALDNKEEALRDFQTAARLSPYDYRTNKQLGHALLNIDPGKAQAAYLAALYYRPDDGELLYALGWNLLNKLNQPRQAAGYLQQAVDQDPENPSYWYTYATALYEQKECRLLRALDEYLAICKSENELCTAKSITWARDTRDSEYRYHCR